MTINEKILDNIETIASDLALTLETMRDIPGMYDDNADDAVKFCCALPERIRSGTLRIAVVGAIKSGKTTFVNAWLKDDLLKRGAGVVTSIVTRVRKGDGLKARIFLKSWDEINREIEQALFLFPEKSRPATGDGSGFDLRREKDRAFLSAFNQEIFSDISVTEDGIRPESVTITRAVDGYETVKDLVKADRSSLEFSGSRFEEHKRFTGDDAVAFFVRDVALEVTSGGLDPKVEIADCQGSDSTNPVHMAQIQDYLASANMIIYLISSRSGLRQADINFLRLIRTMGLMENIVFVVNADMNEHENLEDLQGVEARIKRELTYIKKDPELYTFSSLYNLFSRDGATLNRKSRTSLELWNGFPEFVEYTAAMTGDFNQRLTQRLDTEGFYLAVANPMERVRQITVNSRQRLSLFKDLLSSDLSKAVTAMDMLKEMLERTRKLEAIMDNSMEGAVEVLEKEIRAGADTLFNPDQGSVAGLVIRFIQGYGTDLSRYETTLREQGFENTLYLMFQEFKGALDTFMTQTVSPEITGFAREQEQAIESYFKALYRSYDINPSEISMEFASMVEQMPETALFTEPVSDPIDIRSIRGILGLSLPKAGFATRYSARIRFNSMARFGFFTLAELLARLLKKRSLRSGPVALNAAEARIKKEALRSVLGHLSDYSDTVTNDYLIPLARAISRDFRDKLLARFKVCDVEIETIEGLVASGRESKNAQSNTLEAMETKLEDVAQRIATLPIHYLN
ncbi:MAG: hypothetical protein GY737_21175 [Desulfobacteraceae bacterium]|nr:hypothetical protein [Desulfobacteraceae bacterium]